VRRVGITVMIMGVLVLLAGISVVISFPWSIMKYMQFDRQTGTQQPSTMPQQESMFTEIGKIITWVIYTFMILIANLFLSGIGLILAGYGLYKTSAQLSR